MGNRHKDAKFGTHSGGESAATMKGKSQNARNKYWDDY